MVKTDSKLTRAFLVYIFIWFYKITHTDIEAVPWGRTWIDTSQFLLDQTYCKLATSGVLAFKACQEVMCRSAFVNTHTQWSQSAPRNLPKKIHQLPEPKWDCNPSNQPTENKVSLKHSDLLQNICKIEYKSSRCIFRADLIVCALQTLNQEKFPDQKDNAVGLTTCREVWWVPRWEKL